MRIEVTVIVGDPSDPVAGYSKQEYVYPDDPESPPPVQIMHGTERALSMVEEAQESLQKQATAMQRGLGRGPSEGS